jgi:hypothetical protein
VHPGGAGVNIPAEGRLWHRVDGDEAAGAGGETVPAREGWYLVGRLEKIFPPQSHKEAWNWPQWRDFYLDLGVFCVFVVK